MNNEEENRLLIKIARMYYLNDMTQSEISKSLGIYRTSISRLLKKARDEGVVQIKIIDEGGSNIELESRMEKIFGLKKVIIAESEAELSTDAKKKAVARAGAALMKDIIIDGDIVGFAWGSTMGSLIGEFSDCPQRLAHFVPLVGGPGTMETKYHVNAIVYSIANDFGGEPYLIDAAAVVERKETRDDIVQSNYFRKISELWDQLTVAVVGVGAEISNSNMIWTGFYDDKVIDDLNQQGAIGDICSRFYDSEGKMINSELTERTIAIPLSRLRDTRYSIALAESVEKAAPILAAIKGRYINTLVTTEETALEMIRLSGRKE